MLTVETKGYTEKDLITDSSGLRVSRCYFSEFIGGSYGFARQSRKPGIRQRRR